MKAMPARSLCTNKSQPERFAIRSIRTANSRDQDDLIDDEPVRIVTDAAASARSCRLNVLRFKQDDPIAKEAALVQFIGDYDTE